MEKLELYANETECLRTYDVLGLWRGAENVMRRDFVRGEVVGKKVGNLVLTFCYPTPTPFWPCRRYIPGLFRDRSPPSSRTRRYPLRLGLFRLRCP